MSISENKLIYEIQFKVKCSRASEFEKHCKDVMNLLEGHPGFSHLSYSKRIDQETQNGYCIYRAEICFDSQDSLNNYQKSIVPKIRQSSSQFGDDARVQERRTYRVFCTKSA